MITNFIFHQIIMTKKQFLSTKIPVIPYLVWSSRHSSKYNETVSGNYGKKCIVISLSIFQNEVTIFYNDTSKHEREWYTEIGRMSNLHQYKNTLSNLGELINK